MIIAPSLFNANILNLSRDIKVAQKAGAKYLHIDIMDGKFVPNLSFGSNIVRDLKESIDLFLDCHLMIEKPEDLIDDFIEAGADLITVHVESTKHIYRVIQRIKERKKFIGIAVNPGTPVDSIKELLPLIDQVLVMTVNPGISGEKFIYETLSKIKYLSELRERNDLFNYNIEVDGNITDKTIKYCIESGADVFVSGGYIFADDNIGEKIEILMEAGK